LMSLTVVNYGFLHQVFNHNNTYLSVADCIMPQFYVAVGFGFRLTMLRLCQKEGFKGVLSKVLKRTLALYIIGFTLYGISDFGSYQGLVNTGWALLLLPISSKNLYQTLTVIGVTQVLLLPVITKSFKVILGVVAGYVVAYALLSYFFWYQYCMDGGVIDGGSAGTISWSVCLAVGAGLHDWNVMARKKSGRKLWIDVLWLFGLSLCLMSLAYAWSCMPQGPVCYSPINARLRVNCTRDNALVPPPFFPPTDPISVWNMSQRSATLPYTIFSAALSIPLYLIFFIVGDVFKKQWKPLSIFGMQALFIYMYRGNIGDSLKKLVPEDSPIWLIVLKQVAYVGLAYIMSWWLCANNIFFRL